MFPGFIPKVALTKRGPTDVIPAVAKRRDS